MKGITNKEIKTKNGILIIIAATLIILGGILLTNIDLIFGAGTGDADTLDSMDWDGTECSQADPACNIKAYVDSKSTPCLADNGGQCYISQASKSALDTDLAAGNIVAGKTIFGVTGSAVPKRCRIDMPACVSDYCTIGTLCNASCTAGSCTWSIHTDTLLPNSIATVNSCAGEYAYSSCTY